MLEAAVVDVQTRLNHPSVWGRCREVHTSRNARPKIDVCVGGLKVSVLSIQTYKGVIGVALEMPSVLSTPGVQIVGSQLDVVFGGGRREKLPN